MVLYYEASINLKAPESTSAKTLNRDKPSPDLWTLPKDNSSYHPDNPRRHESQLSTVLMIFQVLTLSITIFLQDSSHNNRNTLQYHRHLPIQHTTQLGRLEKNLTDNKTAQLKADHCTPSRCYIRHNKSKTFAHIEFIPLASPVESSKIRTTCAVRLSNIFHLFSNTTPEQRR